MMSPKQLLTTILIVFSTLSFIKLLLLTHSSAAASSSSPARPLRSPWDDDRSGGSGNGTAIHGSLAAKELALLRSLVAARAPCRLLVFGLSPQLLALAAANSGHGAATAFVTDSDEDADGARRVLGGAPGAAAIHRARMGPIYTAAALARAAAAAGGVEVDVAVHDVDRTVERWYAREYLCEDNLVAAKGRLWHFRVAASGGPSDAFCSTGPVQIL